MTFSSSSSNMVAFFSILYVSALYLSFVMISSTTSASAVDLLLLQKDTTTATTLETEAVITQKEGEGEVVEEERLLTTQQEQHKQESTTSTSSPSRSRNSDVLSTCRVYLAPSTIPGAGMGVFAGMAFDRGEEITTADAIIPLRDMAWNNDISSFDDNHEFLWDEYVWAGDTFEGMPEPGHLIEGASFGIGAAPNCFFPLINAEDSRSIRDNSLFVTSGIDPGSGAFTPYHGRTGHAKREIRAGEEIFVDYGYDYFTGDREEIYGLMPFLQHYKVADEFLHKYRAVVQKYNNNNKNKNNKRQQKQPQQPNDEKNFAHDLYMLGTNVMRHYPTRVYGALPDSAESINYVLDELKSTSFIHYHRSIRSIEWLQQHGACMDHLVIQDSDIPHAGRGAFANKFLPKGTLVAPVPLIHIPNRNVLNVYSSGGYKQRRNITNLVHYQLMLNYCYGHAESTLLLCPYGVASSMVNHGCYSDCNNNNDNNNYHHSPANVKIVWSNQTMSHPEWKDLPLEQWAYTYQAGIAFDYVAIRDIQPGEEVLVDYGSEWQNAWKKHLQSWIPKPILSQQLNNDIVDIPVDGEEVWPWPEVHLWCYNIYREYRGLPRADEVAFPCRVISKRVDPITGETLYNAEIQARFHGLKEEFEPEEGHGKSQQPQQQQQQQQQNDDQQAPPPPPPPPPEVIETCTEILDEVTFDLPRDAFTFGSSFEYDDTLRDYTKPWSFRHDLRIPNDLMPEAWKNFKKKKTITKKEQQQQQTILSS